MGIKGEFTRFVLDTMVEVGEKQGDKIRELQEEIIIIIVDILSDLEDLPHPNDCCIDVEDAIDDLYKKWEKRKNAKIQKGS